MSIWLHRIPHESEVSYPLLDRGLLSIGWSDISSREFLDEVIGKSNDWNALEDYVSKSFTKTGWENPFPRNRHCLYRFLLDMKPGDRVVVPMGNKFGVYEIIKEAVPVSEISLPSDLKTYNNSPVFMKDGFIHTNDYPDGFDIGFIISVKEIARDIPRHEYADAGLTARMKVRQTNVNIDDLQESVDKALKNFAVKRPLNLRYEIVEASKQIVLDKIRTITDPDKFEYLIKRFCEKIGASSVDIPSKNAEKEGDADIIATFESLKLILYIQAKFHVDKTDEWAVEQIRDYKEQFRNIEYDGYFRIAWVVTAGDGYTAAAEKEAKDNNITLINGLQFAEMLLDAGLDSLDI